MKDKDHRRSLLVVAVAFLLLMGSGVGQATTSVESSTPAKAQLSGSTENATNETTINITQTYRTQPNDPGNVTVDLTVENPEVLDNATFEFGFEEEVINTSGFEYIGDTTFASHWSLVTGVDTPTITYELRANHTQNSADYGNWSWIDDPRLPDHTFTTKDGSEGSISVSHQPETGVKKKDWLYVGPYQTYQRSNGSTTIVLIVPDDADTRHPPGYIAGEIANASSHLRADGQGETVTGFVLPKTDPAPGFPGIGGGEKFLVRDSLKLKSVESTWLHELVHTTENVTREKDMKWFVEGYAEYEAARLSLELGYQDYSVFKDHLERGQQEPSTLSRRGTWHKHDEYYQGALVLAAIDRQIRTATDSNETLRTVVNRMDDRESVTVRDFTEIISTVANESVANQANTWVTTNQTPPTWSRAEHEAAFGYSTLDPVNGTTPTDPDGDGLYEDFNGNGRIDFDDVTIYTKHKEDPALTEHISAYDFNGNGRIDFDDVYTLVNEA